MTRNTSDETVPESVGKYGVIRELGRGSTCRVYLARDPFADREVAVKVLAPHMQGGVRENKRFAHAFQSEAALAGRLKHPHIAAIYDAATDGHTSYIVMEYVAGGTLQQYCDPQHLLPVNKVVEIIFKCCRALDYAMRSGVIHRDVKPGNILISHDTEIKISDFGTAFMELAEHTQLTGVGSPAYMSPEQIQEHELTHQTDIYSLGVVMYRLLTGKLPYKARDTDKLMYEILHVEPVPPSSLRSAIPQAVDRIVLRALKKEQSERYPTWLEFAKDLANAFGQLQTSADAFADTEKFNALRPLPFFENFDDTQIWEVLSMATWRRIAPDTVIVREGTEGDSFYIVVQGEVLVARAEQPLDTLGPGDCFGLMLYFAETFRRRTTTITSRGDVVAVEIKASALGKSSHACQVHFNQAFLRILIDRLDGSPGR